MMLDCKGRVVALGMGKAGLIARKVAATLASTGTPALFVNPAEAVHGDLGMITADDLALAFSNRGQTEEILRIIPYLKHIGAGLIAVTGNAQSELARHAEVALILNIEQEACPLNLAPTASTTAMLALGDTLALVLLEARGFGPDDYALLHPGGSLGRRLLTKVRDLMHTGEANPVVNEDTPLNQAIVTITRTRRDGASVIDAAGRLAGFLSGGDLRRYLSQGQTNLSVPVSRIMTRDPKVVHPDMMAAKALEIFRQYHSFIEMPVVDEQRRPIGVLHVHDITSVGIT
jgi:arabinose-5-phosphate isomerase